MTTERANRKRTYEPPKVIQYGDLTQLTKGSHGPNMDGGAGKAGSKQ